jgi:hypothetical protein
MWCRSAVERPLFVYLKGTPQGKPLSSSLSVDGHALERRPSANRSDPG